jgi:hypothetical protein
LTKLSTEFCTFFWLQTFASLLLLWITVRSCHACAQCSLIGSLTLVHFVGEKTAGTPVNRHQLRLRLARSLASSDFALAHHVVFLPRLDREQFSALLSAATVALDTFPFGGGVTTLETLALGTPVLTLPSKQNVPQLGELQAWTCPLLSHEASCPCP